MNEQNLLINRGIYSINFSNNKRYIGMSNNIKERIKEHKLDAKKGDLLPVHIAMRLYEYEIEILEDCSLMSRQNMSEREKYWIKYFDTFLNKNKGYNLTPGGDGGPEGIHNSSAKLDEITIAEVYDLLINYTELYIYEIAARYSISPEAISDINCGRRYYNEFFNYPLRLPPKPVGPGLGINNYSAKFKTQTDLLKIYQELQDSKLTLEEIAKKYNVSYTTISKINRGLTYKDNNYTYPIRKTPKKTNTDYDSIIHLLSTTNQSFTDIAKQFNLSVTTIGRINNGKIHHIKNQKYPIRQ